MTAHPCIIAKATFELKFAFYVTPDSCLESTSEALNVRVMFVNNGQLGVVSRPAHRAYGVYKTSSSRFEHPACGIEVVRRCSMTFHFPAGSYS